MTSFFRSDLDLAGGQEGFPATFRTVFLVMLIGMSGLLFTWLPIGNRQHIAARRWPAACTAWRPPKQRPGWQPEALRALAEVSAASIQDDASRQLSTSSPVTSASQDLEMNRSSIPMGPLPGAAPATPPKPNQPPRMEPLNLNDNMSVLADNIRFSAGIGRPDIPQATPPSIFHVAIGSGSIQPLHSPRKSQTAGPELSKDPARFRLPLALQSLNLARKLGLDFGASKSPLLGEGLLRASAGAAPGSELFQPLARKLAPYFRVCTSNMITPVPFRIPGTRFKACAMACNCDDGAFGIGLYTTRRLAPRCTVAAESICPWQIKTISPSSPVGLALPVQFADSQIVACRLLESRSWE